MKKNYSLPCARPIDTYHCAGRMERTSLVNNHGSRVVEATTPVRMPLLNFRQLHPEALHCGDGSVDVPVCHVVLEVYAVLDALLLVRLDMSFS